MARDRIETYVNFIDTLFSIVVGFMLVEFRILFASIINEGLPILKYLVPFIVLYLLYMLKLAFYWFEAKSDFRIMTHFYSVNITREHYVFMILSAFLYSQLVSSLLKEGSIIKSDPSSVFMGFILWQIMCIVFGDAIPTLTIIIPKTKDCFKKDNKQSKYLEKHKVYFLKIVKNNAFLNIIIPFVSVFITLLLSLTKLSILSIIYAVAAILLTLNILQEIYLRKARKNYLKESIEAI